MFVLPLPRSISHSTLSPSFSRVNDDAFDRFFSNAVPAVSTRQPALDVSETDTAYTVSFDVPGLTREQLKVTVEGRRVNLETVDAAPPVDAAAEAPKADAARPLYRERSTSRYARSVSLPAEVDQTASSAKYENGVLTLTLAKKVVTGAIPLNIG